MDGDGPTIEEMEVKAMLFLAISSPLPSQVEKMVEEFDDDGSGLIEFEEFLVLMAKKVDSSISDPHNYICSINFPLCRG